MWHSGKSSFHLHLVQIASPVFQVAYTAGYHYKALVFDGTSMGAHLYAAVSILRIGKERNKEYLHALVRHDAAQFGELYIVAYQHAYLSTVRIES